MTLEEVKRVVGDTPNMTLAEAGDLRTLIQRYGLSNILELGFAHGVGTCYLAATANEIGGTVTSIDIVKAQERQPNVHELLAGCGLSHLVDVYFEPTSYTWRLMKFLTESPSPRFDFCYLDAAHSWFVDGFGFFLVDRLLKPGGWIVFDDLQWTFGSSPTIGHADWVRAMPADERDTAQVRLVYDLLVRPNPSYTDLRVAGNWAYARKSLESSNSGPYIRTEYVIERPSAFLTRTQKAMLRRFRKKGV